MSAIVAMARESEGPTLRVICENTARHPRHPHNLVAKFRHCDPMGYGAPAWYPLDSPALRHKRTDGSPSKRTRGAYGVNLLPPDATTPETPWDSSEPYIGSEPLRQTGRIECRRCGDNVLLRDLREQDRILDALRDAGREVATLPEVRAVHAHMNGTRHAGTP